MSEYRARIPVVPPPEPPRARSILFPLALSIDGVDVVAGKSRRLYVFRGALGVILLPILFGLLVMLVAFGMLEGNVSDDAVTGIWLVLSGASVVWGVALMALSGPLSRRGAVRFDRTRNAAIVGGVSHPLEGLAVRVRRLPGLSGWNVIELHRQGVPVVTIHDRLQSLHASDVATHADYLACVIGDAPVVAEPNASYGAANRRLLDDNTAAMLCYLPFQGIHLIASLYYLATAGDRPFVRFAARQSLTQLGLTFVALLLFGAGFGVPLAFVASGERELSTASIVLIALLVISLTVLAVANVVVHIVACVRAHGGRTWVIPWLRPIVSKWLPPQPS